MDVKPIPGFSALKFKEECQARVRKEMEGLSPEEQAIKREESLQLGTFGEWWRRSRAEQRAAVRAKLDQEERDDNAWARGENPRREHHGTSDQKTNKVKVILEIDEDGKYIASCPALQGCHSQGDTAEEAMSNIRDAILMCVEELRGNGKDVDLRLPQIVGIRVVEIAD